MTRHDLRPRRTLLRRFHALPAVAGAALLTVLFACLPASVRADAGSSFELNGELHATVGDDAGLTLWTDHWVGDRPLLSVSAPWTPPRRGLLGGAPDPVLRLTHEGAEGGHRGFSSRADDDGDGRVDEDRLDGVDNDGDGLVDEDFAAVGDLMHVVHLSDGAGADLHLETYHWSYEHLREALVVSWTRDDDEPAGAAGDAVLRLPAGRWVRGPLAWPDPDDERPMIYARVADLRGEWWLGVLALEGEPLLVLDGDELRVPVAEHVTIVIAATPTPTQLRCRLATVAALHAGAPLEPGGPSMAWIVPPPVRVDAGFALTAHHHVAAGGGTELDLESARGWPLLPDPAGLRVDGEALGPPRVVAWEPLGDDPEHPAWSVAWPSGDPAAHGAARGIDHLAPFLATRGAGAGRWRLTFDRALPADEDLALEVGTVCGRSFAATSSFLEPPVEKAVEADLEGSGIEGPSLAPHLLASFPNPFRDHVSMRFQVPVTVEEGFVWDEDEVPLLAPTDPIPYASPTPGVSLRIYNLAGHEVATLFDEPCGPGERSVTWNGCDATGRPVAAGTYFCKLQIENWSVTKRVALIR